jgi:hypothetical protein
MKKTDLEKNRAKKLDGRLAASAVPRRYAQGSSAPKAKVAAEGRVAKLVPVSCRLPAELVDRLRERAIGHEGGMSALMAQAVEHWLGRQARPIANEET